MLESAPERPSAPALHGTLSCGADAMIACAGFDHADPVFVVPPRVSHGLRPGALTGTTTMKHNLTLVILAPEKIARAKEANGSRKRVTHALVCGPYGRMFETVGPTPPLDGTVPQIGGGVATLPPVSGSGPLPPWTGRGCPQAM